MRKIKYQVSLFTSTRNKKPSNTSIEEFFGYLQIRQIAKSAYQHKEQTTTSEIGSKYPPNIQNSLLDIPPDIETFKIPQNKAEKT